MKKNMPFSKEAYYQILDTKLNQPVAGGMTGGMMGGTVIDRVLQAAQTIQYKPQGISRN